MGSHLLRMLLPVLLLAVAPVLAGKTCEQMVIDELIARYQIDTTCHEITIRTNTLGVTAAEPEEIEITPLNTREPLGAFPVKVTITRGGQVVATGQMHLTISRYADVLVAADRLLREAVISEQMVETRRMDVTHLGDQVITDLARCEGMRLARNVTRGTVLTTATLERIPDIEPGEQTTIVYNDGLLEITAPGVALQRGCTGDIIRVKNSSTRAVLMARVVNRETVVIEP